MTADRRLALRRDTGALFLVDSNDPVSQLHSLARHFGIRCAGGAAPPANNRCCPASSNRCAVLQPSVLGEGDAAHSPVLCKRRTCTCACASLGLFVCGHAAHPLRLCLHALCSYREADTMSRCAACNSRDLREVPRSQVQPLVPERVFAIVQDFWRCAGCGKVRGCGVWGGGGRAGRAGRAGARATCVCGSVGRGHSHAPHPDRGCRFTGSGPRVTLRSS